MVNALRSSHRIRMSWIKTRACWRQFAFGGTSTKGVMQRFMASHGKLVTPNSALPPVSPLGNISIPGNYQNGNQQQQQHPQAFLENGNSRTGITTVTLLPAAIEPSEGKPLRRGYVSVEQKIQQELQDLKALKRLRKINRHNTLKASLDKLQLRTDDGADSVEHCCGPGKLRNVQL
ncbi:hypothetical protein KR200_004560 [Drosophila serrata]|nr:hypothetical protein KR200_004560 [Drosophila serrata]